MEIKSSLFNTSDMHPLRDNLIAISEIDGKQDFRVKLLNYIDDVTQEDDDQYFWEMMENIRFMSPDTDGVACTTPHKLIYLNAPGDKIGEKIRVWEFVYDHECLHQLWDTFGIAEKIKKNGLTYNHDLLNIASDCVINDYLKYNRKKEAPDFGIFPEVLKEQYDVEYNRKEDTQYSLYVKMLKSPKVKDLEELAKQMEKLHNGKLTPKQIEQTDGGGGGGGPTEKHSDEYKRGWVDGINDVLDKKVDPTKFTPKEVKGDYEQGYNDALEQIKEGVEKGIQQSKNNDGNSGESSDLPQIPWDAPSIQDQKNNSSSNDGESNNNDSSDDSSDDSNKDVSDMNADEAAKSAEQSAKEAQSAAAQAQAAADGASGKDAEAKQQEADKAKEAAEKAKNAADKAKDAADSGNKSRAQAEAEKAKEAAKEAKKAAAQAGAKSQDSDIDNMSASEAAKEAQKSAKAAQDAADKAKEKAQNASANNVENAEVLEDAAKAAQEAADKAQDAADKAQEAATDNDTDSAQEAAKEARKQMKKAQDNASKQEGRPGKGWSHAGNVKHAESDPSKEREADLEEIEKRATSIIKKWQQKLTGDIGLFNEKCNNSLTLNPSGLAAKTNKAVSLWNDKMTTYISSFVKQKVFAKHREYKRTYKRIKRGSGIVKFGEPLQKGKMIKDDKLTINVAFYVDISGSMYHCIENVFEAAYSISKTLDIMFGRDAVVEDLSYKMFTFNDYIKEIKWGNKVPASGGNVEFSEIVKYMSQHTKEFMINVVITDAQFDIGKNKVKEFMKGMDGMLLFITNQGSREMEELSKELEGQVFYIKADNNFTIDEKNLR